jgi:hypothetical protein
MSSENKNKLFTKTYGKEVKKTDELTGQVTTQVETVRKQTGFLEFISEDIRKILILKFGLGEKKYDVKAGDFAKHMRFYDELNAADYRVTDVNTKELEKFEYPAVLERFLIAPRDVRLFDDRRLTNNVIRVCNEGIDYSLDYMSHNIVAEYVAQKLKGKSEPLASEITVDTLEKLLDRPIVRVHDDGSVDVRIPEDSSKVVVPVYMDAAVANVFFPTKQFVYDVEDLTLGYLENLKKSLGVKEQNHQQREESK